VRFESAAYAVKPQCRGREFFSEGALLSRQILRQGD
jgi:hypothetical protein